MKRFGVRCLVGLLAMVSLAVSAGALGGCERQLFKDTDTRASEARLRPFGTYDSESVRTTRERRTQARDWGFGLPGMNTGGM